MCEEASRRATPDRAGARPYQRLRGSRDGTSLPAPTRIARRHVPTSAYADRATARPYQRLRGSRDGASLVVSVFFAACYRCLVLI
jgi:hypothetical protein